MAEEEHDRATWRELEAREQPARLSGRRKAAGVGALALGALGLGLSAPGRAAAARTGRLALRLETVGGALVVAGVVALAPLAKAPEALVTPTAPTHSGAARTDHVEVFHFEVLNGRWEEEVERLERKAGPEALWLPPDLREMFIEARKRERRERRERLLAKERALEEEIRRELAPGGLSTRELAQKLSKRVYVVDFADYEMALPDSGELAGGPGPGLDSTAGWVALFRDTVSMLLKASGKFDEVLLRLSSPGGSVSEYGLAAAHMMRLRRAGVRVTCCIDTVCASGGYMMACAADRVVAAPFAMVGSIGVVAELPNFHRLLHDRLLVDYLLVTAGEYKRTVHSLAETSPEGVAKLKEELEAIHEAFKGHVKEWRPQVDLAEVATGEAWLAAQVLEKGLVDELATSDEILERKEGEGFDLIKVSLREPGSPGLVEVVWDHFLGRAARAAQGVGATLRASARAAFARALEPRRPTLLARL